VDPAKAQVYSTNFGRAEFCCADIGTIDGTELPGHADLAWISPPCQDLSDAGHKTGLSVWKP
jgi:DNA (cytosine-5)-methyltransferase 1